MRILRRAGAAAAALVLLGTLASAPARAQVAPTPSTTSFGVIDYDRDGHQDLVARTDATGDLYLYPGQSVRGYSTAGRVKIGNGWNGTTPYGLGDWDRDGCPDIVVRFNGTGDLWLYPGQCTRGYSYLTPVKLFPVSAFTRDYAPFGGMIDWNRDGKLDILTRSANGYVYLWEGYGTRQPQPGYTVTALFSWSSSYNVTAFGAADWQRDGNPDLMVRNNANGNLYVYLGNGTLFGYLNATGRQIGNGWGGTTPFGLADWDRDGHQDIVERNDTSCVLWLYPGQSVLGYSQIQPMQIGYGF